MEGSISEQYGIAVPAKSTFGVLKQRLAPLVGLKPEEERLLFRGKEKNDRDCLHEAGVKNMPMVVLLEDPASRERRIEQKQCDEGIARACDAVLDIRHEVNKLAGKVSPLESSVHSGSQVAEQDFVVLTELLMRQLLKVDGIETEGEARVRRRNEVSNKADIVNKVVYDILQHGEEWNKFRRTSLKKKIEHCILLDNFVPNVGVSMDARAKALQSHSKRPQKHMSLQQHRKYGSFNMPKEFRRFELFKPMHDMWKAYILELLQESSKKQLAQCFLAADLHGAFIVVVECKTRSFVGISGIMIRETTETFGIIKRDNHFRVVPKRGSVFVFQAGCWKVTLHGDKLSSRNIA